MEQPDRLSELLKEWNEPKPQPELDQRVTAAYRAAMGATQRRSWRKLLTARISVPVPVLALAALAAIALILWIRPASAPPAASAPAAPSTATSPDVVTRMTASGFQPLPNGAARVISAKEVH